MRKGNWQGACACAWSLVLGACVFGLALSANPAQAQFVCGGSAKGIEPQNNDGADADGNGSVSCGTSAGVNAFGTGNTAFGARSGQDVEGNNNTAIGFGAGAGGDVNFPASVSNSVAVGANARAAANGSIAVGAGASAEADGSVAIGTGAKATRANQFALGTGSSTYTMAGITSPESKSAQGTPTHFVTSNANGDLAAYTAAELGLVTTGGLTGLQSQINSLGRRDLELAEGIAISLALSQPILRGHQTFGLNLGWGNFDGSNAVGVTAAGVVAENPFGSGSSMTIYGGVGAGTDRGMLAGKAGVSFGW